MSPIMTILLQGNQSRHLTCCCGHLKWLHNNLCLPFPNLTRYQQSSRYKKMRYEDEFLRYLQSIMADVDRRIRRGHARLNLSRAQEEKVCLVCPFHFILAIFNYHLDELPTILHILCSQTLIFWIWWETLKQSG